MDRRQRKLHLVILSLNNFTELSPVMYGDASPPHAETPSTQQHAKTTSSTPIVQVIYAQESPVWINVHDLLHFLPTNTPDHCRFVWANQDTGYRHLYVVTAKIQQVADMTDVTSATIDELEPDFVFLQPKILSKVALTSGEWEVLAQDLWVDDERQLVYFLGLRETPLEKHLYVVSLRRPGEVRLLTIPGFSYTIDFNKVQKIFGVFFFKF